MRKIVSLIIACIMAFSPILQVSADSILDEKKIAVKNILVTKSQLKKISNGEKYILAMDSFAEKLKSNPEKVRKIRLKVNTAMLTLIEKQVGLELLTPKEHQLLTILRYLEARLQFIALDQLQKQQEADENKFKEILEQAENPNISDADKKELESAIISIQKNLLEQSQQNIENILGDFEDYFNYESKGDFEMNFKSDHEEIGNINAEFKLSNYVNQASNFDSRFNGHISAMIDALPKGEEAVKTQMSSFVDFISKDGQIFALVKDLNITTEENLEDFQDILDTLKELAQENKYVEISDQQTAEVMKIVKSFNPDLLFNDAHDLFSKPMFTAYKKENDVFHIIPTKYACDSLKVIANKFDPFSPNSCTENQYNDIIEDLLTQGELTMTLGKKNVLNYSQYPDNHIEKLDINLAFTNNSIEFMQMDIQGSGDKISLNFENNKFLNFVLYGQNGEVDINFESSLDSRNNFSYIKHNGYLKDWTDEYTWNLDIKNRKINGSFKVESPKREYNYETREYEDLGKQYFEANLNGTTDSRNEVSSITIDYKGNDSEVDYLTGEFIYNIPELKFVSVYQDEYGKADFHFEGKWNTRNENFDSFDTQIEITQKERTFDYETYSYQYSGEEEKVFDLDYSLENTQVKGTLNAYDNNEVIFGVTTNGTYKKDQLQLNNELRIDFINNLVGYADAAKDSKRYSDVRMLASAIETYQVKEGRLPNTETFWEELKLNKDNFKDPDGNIEKNNCKYGYTYSKSNRYYQLSTCLSNSSKDKHSVGNYYEGAIETLGEPVYLHGYTSWTQQEEKEESTPLINVNFNYDYTSNKTDSQVYVDMILDNEKAFEMNMKNTGTIEYKTVEIETPSNTVPMEEVIETDIYYY